jgi:hypothetical protein
MHKMHRPEPDIDGLYVNRRRALLQMEATHTAEISNTAECLKTNSKEGQFVNVVKSHES